MPASTPRTFPGNFLHTLILSIQGAFVACVNILKQVKFNELWKLVAIPKDRHGRKDWKALAPVRRGCFGGLEGAYGAALDGPQVA